MDRIRTEVLPGVVMDLDENDYVQREILYKGGYELATLAQFDLLLQTARGFTDFGGHMGQYTLRAARSLAPRGGKVFCIEPTPVHAQAVTHNAALSGLRNIQLCTAAFSDAPGILRMIAPHPNNSGGARLATDTTKDLSATALLVPVRPASEVANLIPVECMDLVKLDVEGHEFRVLHSLFSACSLRPRDIIFEYLPDDFNLGNPAAELEWLRTEGYTIRDVAGRPFSPLSPLLDSNIWAHRES